MKLIRKGAKNASPEQKTKDAVEMIARALSMETGEISEELRADILFEGMDLVASVPRTRCANCNRPIAIHESTKIGEKPYCESCAGRIQRRLKIAGLGVLRMNETDVITVTDKAILVNGVQDSWALKTHKLEYLYESLENAILDVDVTADAYLVESGEYPHDYMSGSRSIENDEDDVAWS